MLVLAAFGELTGGIAATDPLQTLDHCKKLCTERVSAKGERSHIPKYILNLSYS